MNAAIHPAAHYEHSRPVTLPKPNEIIEIGITHIQQADDVAIDTTAREPTEVVDTLTAEAALENRRRAILAADVDDTNVRERCHEDDLKAAIILIQHYHDAKLWVELEKTCIIAWETVVRHRDEKMNVTEEMIRLVYENYLLVVQMHAPLANPRLAARATFSVLYQMTLEYKDIIAALFTENCAAYTAALIALAKICETIDEYHDKAVSLYEEVDNRTKAIKA